MLSHTKATGRSNALRTVDEDDEGFSRPLAPQRNHDGDKQTTPENSDSLALVVERGRSNPVSITKQENKMVLRSQVDGGMSFNSDTSSFMLTFQDDEESSVFLENPKSWNSSSSVDATVVASNTTEYVLKKKWLDRNLDARITEINARKTAKSAIPMSPSMANEAQVTTTLRPQIVIHAPRPGICAGVVEDLTSATPDATTPSKSHPETQETTPQIGDTRLVTDEIVDSFQTEYGVRQKVIREEVCADIVTPKDIKSIRRKQWCLLIVMMLLFIGGGVALGLVMSGTFNKGAISVLETYPPSIVPTSAPSAPPSSTSHNERYDAFEDILRPLVGASLDEKGSPQQKAFAWLVDDDVTTTLGDLEDQRYIVERYTLVVLYFALHGPDWTTRFSFLSSDEHCLWNDGDNGVFCDDSSVSRLNLSKNNLTGAIPPETGHLTSLILLNISENAISGDLPPIFGKLTRLRQLDCGANQLIGSIPSEIFQISSINAVWLEDNHFTGTLPHSVVNATQLEYLSIANNKLNGTIHGNLSGLVSLKEFDLTNNELVGSLPSFGAKPSIQTLHLDGNSFTGSIPASIGKCTSLQILTVFGSLLSGSIPAELAALPALTLIDLERNKLSGIIPPFEATGSNLQRINLNSNQFSGNLDGFFTKVSNRLTDVDFGNNPRISGTIPQSISSYNSLKFLSLNNNSLTGTLPTILGRLTNLEKMTLSFNNVSGEIPSELGLMNNLTSLSCAGNKLRGTIPTDLARLTALETMRLQFNSLTGDMSLYCSSGNQFVALEADCFKAVNCTCCTTCCDSDSCQK